MLIAKLSRWTIGLGLSVIAGGSVFAGDLVPPVGPVLPTLKTLVDVEPRIAVNSLPSSATAIHRISESGSYYLTGNITGESGKNGIEVFIATGVERGVSIDLNGYNVVGVPGSLRGISSSFSVALRNGLVSSWGGDGVNIAQGLVTDVRAKLNGGKGIRGLWSVSIRNCTAESNTGDGISGADNCNIIECLSKGNAGRGISLDGIGVICDCAIYNNALGGILALVMTQVTRCSFSSNGGPSIEVDRFCRVTDNQILGGMPGILVTGEGNRIESNLLSSLGIRVESTDNLIVRNSVLGNPVLPFDVVPGNMLGPVTSDPASAGEWANFVSP